MNALLFDFNLVPRCLVSQVLGLALETFVIDSITADATPTESRYAVSEYATKIVLIMFLLYSNCAMPCDSCVQSQCSVFKANIWRQTILHYFRE